MTTGRLSWLAWPLGMVNDGKLGLAADHANISMAAGLGIWALLLEEAAAASDRGSVEHIHYGAMARTLGISHDEVARFVDEAVAIGLIVDGRIARRDYFEARRVDPTNADRSRRWRVRETSGANVGALGTATLRQRYATLRNVANAYRQTDRQTDGQTDISEGPADPLDSIERQSPATPGHEPVEQAAVRRVFDHWRQIHGHSRAQLDQKRRRLIVAALKAYSEADLCQSITGYRNSPHHMGENDRGTVYDSVDLLLRDAAHIDAGLRFYAEPPRTDLSKLTRRNVAAVEDWEPPEDRHAGG